MSKVKGPAIDGQVGVKEPVCKTSSSVKNSLRPVYGGARHATQNARSSRQAHRPGVERLGQAIQIGERRIELMPTAQANSRASLHQLDGALPGEAIYMPPAFEHKPINPVAKTKTVGYGDH